jgi:hypothetical protein
MAKNLLYCETGFGVYRSTQLGHIPFFLLLYLLVGPSIVSPIGGATGGSGNLSTSLSNVARLRHIQNLCGFSMTTAMGQ